MEWPTALSRSLKALLLAALAGSATARQQATAQPDPDDTAWATARDAGTVEACQRYLEEFPVGRHMEEAFRCVIEKALPPLAPLADAPAVEPDRRPDRPDDDRAGGILLPRIPPPGPGSPTAAHY